MTATVHLLPHVCRQRWMTRWGCYVVLGTDGKLYAREPLEQTMRAVLRNMEAFVEREVGR